MKYILPNFVNGVVVCDRAKGSASKGRGHEVQDRLSSSCAHKARNDVISSDKARDISHQAPPSSKGELEDGSRSVGDATSATFSCTVKLCKLRERAH